MALNKTNEFSASLVRLAALAKALSHPGRLRILEVIAERRSCLCGEIVAELPLAQPTVSQHLRELKRVGLIQGEIEGPRTCYCLDPTVLTEARQAFDRLFAGVGCCQPEG